MTLIRSALFNLFFFASTALLLLPGVVLTVVAPRRVLGYATAWSRLEIAALRVICGIRYRVTGAEHLPASGPVLIAPRHQSAFDTMIWMILLPRPCYVLKQELLRIPLFGRMLTAAGMIAIDRSAGASALRALLQAGAAAAADQRQIVIFPEGTRAEPGAPVKLQAGVAALAAKLDLPLLPVATDSGRFWGRRAFRKVPGTIRIAIGAPIDPGLDRRLLMDRLGAAIGDAALEGAPVNNSVG